MKTLQFREAIAEAMSEEMRKDPSIYLMGEEVAEYNGAYKASKGMFQHNRNYNNFHISLHLYI